MTLITHQRVAANGITIHIAEAGQGPLVLLLHGYPELWYSWRHQLPALAEAGYHAVAPDLRGIGETDAPEAVDSYGMLHLVADAIGLLDSMGTDAAVLAGHDWGARVAWHTAELHPARVTAVAALSVPYYPRAPSPPTEVMAGTVRFFEHALGSDDTRRALYRLLYALSGDAPPDLLRALFAGGHGADIEVLRHVQPPASPPPWLTDADLDYYARAFALSGFEGVLNRYRNLVKDWEELAGAAGARVEQPALFIGGERDSPVVFGSLAPMQAAVPRLRRTVLLPGCGHWVQQERPGDVNRELIDFLRSAIEPN